MKMYDNIKPIKDASDFFSRPYDKHRAPLTEYLFRLISAHATYTKSPLANRMLNNWDTHLKHFLIVIDDRLTLQK